jgi:hypothetical protein
MIPETAEEFLLERKVTFLADRTTIEIEHENIPVEARDPNFVTRHGCAPANSINAHAGEAGYRWRESGSVGGEFRDAAANAFVNAGLRARRPVLPAPEVALCIEHQPAVPEITAAREGQREGEVVRYVAKIRHEGCLARRDLSFGCG